MDKSKAEIEWAFRHYLHLLAELLASDVPPSIWRPVERLYEKYRCLFLAS
jgi:hypothetical protein